MTTRPALPCRHCGTPTQQRNVVGAPLCGCDRPDLQAGAVDTDHDEDDVALTAGGQRHHDHHDTDAGATHETHDPGTNHNPDRTP